MANLNQTQFPETRQQSETTRKRLAVFKQICSSSTPSAPLPGFNNTSTGIPTPQLHQNGLHSHEGSSVRLDPPHPNPQSQPGFSAQPTNYDESCTPHLTRQSQPRLSQQPTNHDESYVSHRTWQSQPRFLPQPTNHNESYAPHRTRQSQRRCSPQPTNHDESYAPHLTRQSQPRILPAFHREFQIFKELHDWIKWAALLKYQDLYNASRRATTVNESSKMVAQEQQLGPAPDSGLLKAFLIHVLTCNDCEGKITEDCR